MKEKKEAISGTVTGNDQHVGFRAMIMKQAIEYNLAGRHRRLSEGRDFDDFGGFSPRTPSRPIRPTPGSYAPRRLSLAYRPGR
jgi:hypothetical protein